MLIEMKMSEPEIFRDNFEASLCSGGYLWLSDDTILYNKDVYNIFNDIELDILTENVGIELKGI